MDQGLRVIVIGAGMEPEDNTHWRDRFSITSPMAMDLNMTLYYRFTALTAVPFNVILDENLVVRELFPGYSDEYVRQVVTALLAERIWIAHTPHPNTEDLVSSQHVTMAIEAGEALDMEASGLFWRVQGSPDFQRSALTDQGGGSYDAEIPAQSLGTLIEYYIQVQNISGIMQSHPLNAPGTLHIFEFISDTEPPVILHEPVARWPVNRWGPVIQVQITDQLPVSQVILEYSVDSGSTQTTPMVRHADGIWQTEITDPVSAGSVIEYAVTATDTAVVPNTARIPQTAGYQLDAVPTFDAVVIDLDGNQNSGPVIQSHLEDQGLESHYLNEFPRWLDVYSSLWICQGVSPDDCDLTEAEIVTLMKFMFFGGSVYREGGNAWPNILDQQWFLQDLMGCTRISTGFDDAVAMVGVTGSPARGFQFEYTGDNENIDRLSPWGESCKLFENSGPTYCAMTIKESESNSIISSSIEFGGLGGTESSPSDLMMLFCATMGLVPYPTPTPDPSPTAVPSATPTPGACGDLGADIRMPAHLFQTGDPCWCRVSICNPGDHILFDVPLFVILDIHGTLFFWPDFSGFDYERADLVPGETEIEILPEFAWPPGTGSASGIIWYAGMTDPGISELLGSVGSWTFGWE